MLDGSTAAWEQIQDINVAQLVTDNNYKPLEDVIDALLSYNVEAEDPCSFSMHNYLQILQPLQLAVEYTWSVYSRKTALHSITARCLTAASAFQRALQQHAAAALAETEHFTQTQISSPSTSMSEQIRVQLQPLKEAYDAMRAALKAEEVYEHTKHFGFRSRSLPMNWAVLHNISTPQLDNSEWWEALLSVLPTLAYGDMCQESWQDLKTSDCIHFIQLAQCALAYMLYEADAADTKLQEARRQLQQEENAVKTQLKPAKTTDRNGLLPAPPAQPMQPRPTSPVRGSQVCYRASTESPVVVPGSMLHATPVVQPPQLKTGTLEQVTKAEDGMCHEQANGIDIPQSGSITYVTEELEVSLRNEQSQLHAARSQVADLWSVMASLGQETSLVYDDTPSAPQIGWEPDEIAIHDQAKTPINHTTVVNLDLEALRAAERRHAEAQIRASFADIKQRAFRDMTQRLSRSSDRAANTRQESRTFRNEISHVQPSEGTSKHAGRGEIVQSIQKFSVAAPVSQMVNQLRSSSGMQYLPSSDLQRQPSNARPPKSRGFHVQPSSHSSHDVLRSQSLRGGGQKLNKVPLDVANSSLLPSKLMRLTSCVKLNKTRL